MKARKLGRKKHLEHLEQEIIDLRQSWHQMQSKVQHTQGQLTALQAVDISGQLQALRTQAVHLMQSWAELNSRLNHVSERIDDCHRRKEKNIESLRDIESRVQTTSIDLEEKKTKYKDYAQSMEQSEEQYQAIQRQLNEADSGCQ